MKKIFTFCALLAAMSLNASKINLHLTGCTGNEGNPTEYTEEDTFVELYFIAESGYTMSGAEVSVVSGEITLTTDYNSEDGFYYYEGASGYLSISFYDDLTDDIEVTIACKLDAGHNPLPATFSAASFEEETFAMEENSVYRPESFLSEGKQWLYSGAVAAYTSVEDWSMWYGPGHYGFSATQVVNYAANANVTVNSDAYLPMAAPAVAHGKNYASTNIMGLFETIDLTPTTLSGVAITNTKSVANAVIKGDNYSENEGEEKGAPFRQGDYFVLHITGLREGVVTKTIDFYLADFRTAGNWYYVENWQWVELSTLGEVDQLQFSMEGTKANSMGLTTPKYFCWDNLGGNKADCTLGEVTKVTPTAISNTAIESVVKTLRNGQLIIRRDGVEYNVMGQTL